MKKKLLVLACLVVSLSWGKPKDKEAPPGPAIGLLMHGEFMDFNTIDFEFRIKNTGTETLTNIQISPNTATGFITFNFVSIPDLAPGEEITGLHGYKIATCFDLCQTSVTATTLSNTTVSDLSSDPNSGGNYYNDNYSATNHYVNINSSADGVYQDLNNNALIDVGDAINYTYTLESYDFLSNVSITDSNATITTITPWNNNQILATGIHYITQSEIDYGYVYGYPIATVVDNCNNYITLLFQDTSFCSCPNPNNASIITPLTTLSPHRISGNVKFNNNNDNCATGVNFPYRRVDTSDNFYNYATYTSYNGDYYLLIPNASNTYTTTALTNLNANFVSNPSAIVTNTLSSGTPINYNNNNFCISAVTSYSDLSVMMYHTTQAIPGSNASYIIYFQNNGTTNLNGNLQLTYDNGKVTFNTASVPADSATANTLTWNYTNLLPFEWRYITLSFNVLIPPTVNAGDILAYLLNGNTTVTDDNPADNTFSINQVVSGSFDPNDKTVIEGASISTTQVPNYLHYVTRFQNTGTANATTVVIKETLDPKLDWNTFEPIASSHSSNIQIKNGNDLTYTFSNIDLPYATADEPASHGWIAYRIKPKSNVVVNDIMSSSSDIYFDYNAPIVTNTVTTQVTTLSTTDFIKNNFAVYPNPATNYIVIQSKTNDNATYEIIDLNGKTVLQDQVISSSPIDVSALQSGFYFLNLKTAQGKAIYKLIKN